MSNYRYGAIWLINFEPQVGSEIKKTRPALIISRTEFNLKRQKITILPFTSFQKKTGASRVFVPKSSTNGLAKDSEAIAISPATFDRRRFVKFLGELESELLDNIKHKLRLYLNL